MAQEVKAPANQLREKLMPIAEFFCEQYDYKKGKAHYMVEDYLRKSIIK